MQVVLVMFRADGERRSFSVSRDMTVIGRREDCDLRIPLGEISRKHCRLIKEDGTLRLEDLGSSNGTYLNGKRVQEAAIEAGDTLQVGPVVFVVQIDGEPQEEDMQPVVATSKAAAERSEGAATAAVPGDDEDALPPGLEDSDIPEADAMDFDLAEDGGEAGGGSEGGAGEAAAPEEPMDSEDIAAAALAEPGEDEETMEGGPIDFASEEEEGEPHEDKKR